MKERIYNVNQKTVFASLVAGFYVIILNFIYKYGYKPEVSFVEFSYGFFVGVTVASIFTTFLALATLILKGANNKKVVVQLMVNILICIVLVVIAVLGSIYNHV